jgi:hypothetical protein
MADKFTIYRQQPTPKALEKLVSGEYTKWPGYKDKNVFPSKHTGKWWSPHTQVIKNFDGALYKQSATGQLVPVKKITEVLKAKTNINDFVKGWKESRIHQIEKLEGRKPNKADLKWINNAAKEIKDLYKTNKPKFFKSLVYSQEAILDSVDNARTSIRQTFKVNPQRALVKGAEYLGKGAAFVGSRAAGPAAFFLGTKEVGDAELPFPEKRNKKPKGYSNVKGYSNAPRKAQTYG